MINFTIINITRMFKDKRVIFVIFLVPILIVAVIGVLMPDNNQAKKVKVDIVNMDKGLESSKLIEELKQDLTYDINLTSYDKINDGVRNGDVALGIVINDGYTRNLEAGISPEIKLLNNGSVSIYPIQNRMDTIVRQDMLKNKINAKAGAKVAVPKIVNVTIEDNYKPYKAGFVLSFILNYMMYSMIYIIQEVNDFRKWKILKRSYSTPNSGVSIMGGLLFALLLIMILQNTALNLLSGMLIKTPLASDLLGGFFIFTAFSLVILSMGIFIARFAKNNALVPVVINLIVVPTGIISGTFMPEQYLPGFLSKLSFLAPQYWAFNGIEKLGNGGIIAAFPNIAVLILIAACFFAAGTLRFQGMLTE